METKNEEVRSFVELIKMRNEEIEYKKLPTAEELVGSSHDKKKVKKDDD